MYKTLKQILFIGLILSNRCNAAAEEMTKQEATEFMEQIYKCETFKDCMKCVKEILDEVHDLKGKRMKLTLPRIDGWIVSASVAEKIGDIHIVLRDVTYNQKPNNSELFRALNNFYYQDVIEIIRNNPTAFNYYNHLHTTPFHTLCSHIEPFPKYKITVSKQLKINIAFIKAFLILYNDNSYEILNQKQINGNTPLILLLLFSTTEVVHHPLYIPMLELLLDAGADPLITKDGLNHLQLLIAKAGENKSPAYPFQKDIKLVNELLTNYMNR